MKAKGCNNLQNNGPVPPTIRSMIQSILDLIPTIRSTIRIIFSNNPSISNQSSRFSILLEKFPNDHFSKFTSSYPSNNPIHFRNFSTIRSVIQIKIFLKEIIMNPTLRHVKLDDFELITSATNRCDWRGQSYIAYKLLSPSGDTIFEGQDFAGSPLYADDSDDTLRALFGFLTLRLGDTDRDYFDNYTPEQIQFRDTHAESLGIWSDDEGPAFIDVEESFD